ncbi:MAG: hypothetical protein K0Q57_674, partial [Gammaproteobacteria bacterium]|nr:hypothetical protein [Gammaproteobacteria bacterium]
EAITMGVALINRADALENKVFHTSLGDAQADLNAPSVIRGPTMMIVPIRLIQEGASQTTAQSSQESRPNLD